MAVAAICCCTLNRVNPFPASIGGLLGDGHSNTPPCPRWDRNPVCAGLRGIRPPPLSHVMSGLMNNGPAMDLVSRDHTTHYIYHVTSFSRQFFSCSARCQLIFYRSGYTGYVRQTYPGKYNPTKEVLRYFTTGTKV